MVLYDILTISDDAKQLIVKAHVSKANYYKKTHITDIYIDTENTFQASVCPNIAKCIYHKSFYKCTKSIDLTINAVDLKITDENVKDFSSNLFFVYIVTDEADGCGCNPTPCGLNSIYNLGVTFDQNLLYNIGLGYIGELADTCNIPMGFTDFVLHWNGFKLLLDSEHYLDAIEVFKKIFKQNPYIGKNSCNKCNCGCHGKLHL